MTYNNAAKLGPQTEAEAIKWNWHRMDCLAKYQLNNERDHKKLMAWFAKQGEEWKESRKQRFTIRSNEKFRLYR